MPVMPNFDDPIFDEVRRSPGARLRSKLKPQAHKTAKRGKAAKRAAGGRAKRSSR